MSMVTWLLVGVAGVIHLLLLLSLSLGAPLDRCCASSASGAHCHHDKQHAELTLGAPQGE